MYNFYPRPPRGGRLGATALPGIKQDDFYPRPPRGGRRAMAYNSAEAARFLSTPSARRATQAQRLVNADGTNFYPRPPRGGRLAAEQCEEASDCISIHALREEGDRFKRRQDVKLTIFLSTPSARRATAKTETKALFSNKLYNILHEFRRALIYNWSKNYPNRAK